MRRFARLLTVLTAPLLAPAALLAQDVSGPSFKEGDVIGYDQIDSLQKYLPKEFWDNRDFFFYEGMKLTIGPAHADYAPSEAYQAATKANEGKAKVGAENSLSGYVTGQPFPAQKVDCKSDPEAGAKIAWNFDRRWDGEGGAAKFIYSYWDRGERLPLYYEGKSRRVWLNGRADPEYQATGGEVFRGDARKRVTGIEVEAPFDSRGLTLLTYRYKDSENPQASTRNDDTWVYSPALRRVRRISSAQRADAVAGTDFTFDDLFSFDGIVPQYEWKCLGQRDLLAPMNSRVQGYPLNKEHNFGPFGLSYADDTWDLRKAVVIEFQPRAADHPYSKKVIYIDEQSMEPLYSFAYDRKGELWKLIWHNHRWSEDPGFKEYKGWPGVEKPRDIMSVSDTIVNVQTGTGNRIEYWDRNGTPFDSKGALRRYIDQNRLTKGR
jgi:hypothetical protein